MDRAALALVSTWVAGAFLALESQPTEREPPAADDPGLHLLALRIERGERQAWIRSPWPAPAWPLCHQTAFTIYCQDPRATASDCRTGLIRFSVKRSKLGLCELFCHAEDRIGRT